MRSASAQKAQASDYTCCHEYECKFLTHQSQLFGSLKVPGSQSRSPWECACCSDHLTTETRSAHPSPKLQFHFLARCVEVRKWAGSKLLIFCHSLHDYFLSLYAGTTECNTMNGSSPHGSSTVWTSYERFCLSAWSCDASYELVGGRR